MALRSRAWSKEPEPTVTELKLTRTEPNKPGIWVSTRCQASTFDVRSPAEAFSLLYLNPPYDLEVGATNNQRLELVFLEQTYRWLKPGGVLVFVIPKPQVKVCARILSEHFTDLAVTRASAPVERARLAWQQFGLREKAQWSAESS
jgi:hypothetical protein